MADMDQINRWKGEKLRLEQIFENKAIEKLKRIEAAVQWSNLPFDECRKMGMRKVEEILRD